MINTSQSVRGWPDVSVICKYYLGGELLALYDVQGVVGVEVF